MINRLRCRVFIFGLLLLLGASAFAQPPWAWEPPWRGPARGPQLGVYVEELAFDRLDALHLSYGVEVAQVMPGSPAETGGLRAGDILLEINKQPAFSSPRLRWLIEKTAPGSRVELTIYRDGETSTLEIPLQEPSAYTAQAPRIPHEYWTSTGQLGISLQSLNRGLREAFSVPDNIGVLVVEVYRGGAADGAGLLAGDVIVKMDQQTVTNINDVQRVLGIYKSGQAVKLEVIRDKKPQQLELTLAETRDPQGFGGWREWMAPFQQDPPFFADPQWWGEMQDRMQQWRYDWQKQWQQPSQGTL